MIEDINFILQHGSTPIHIAAKFGHTELISKFAAAGVNLRQVSRKTGLSALHVASFYGMEGNYVCANLFYTLAF